MSCLPQLVAHIVGSPCALWKTHRATRTSVYGVVVQIWRQPHLFDVVEFPDFWAEDVDDDVTGVDQNPIGTAHSFDPREPELGILQRRDQMIGDGCDMSVRASGRDDHMVAERGLALQVDRDDFFCLGVFETGKDEFEGARYVVNAAYLCRRRLGFRLLL